MNGIEWSPGIGDPTVMGWVTVVAYFAVGWLCLRAFASEKRGPARSYFASIPAVLRVVRKHWPRPPERARRALLWLIMGAALLFLGVNKQLDLQTLVTELGKAMARSQGWYDQRRTVQFVFIGIIALGGLLAVGCFAWLARGQLRDFRVPFAGMAFIVCFVVIRAASFHHVDELIGFELGGVRMNWVLELSGIGVVGFGAWRQQRRPRDANANSDPDRGPPSDRSPRTPPFS